MVIKLRSYSICNYGEYFTISKLAFPAKCVLAIGIVCAIMCSASCDFTSSYDSANISTSNVRYPETMQLVKDSMAFIKNHHPDAAPYISDATEYERISETGIDIQGYSGAVYQGRGWTIKVGSAITAQLLLEIRSEYDEGKIVWVGFYEEGEIIEDSYEYVP